jgi:hypothetical protein
MARRGAVGADGRDEPPGEEGLADSTQEGKRPLFKIAVDRAMKSALQLRAMVVRI